MAKVCDICKDSIGIRGFKCIDGLICRKCYQIVTDQFSGTITDKTLHDLKIIYVNRVYQSELLMRKKRNKKGE